MTYLNIFINLSRTKSYIKCFSSSCVYEINTDENNSSLVESKSQSSNISEQSQQNITYGPINF